MGEQQLWQPTERQGEAWCTERAQMLRDIDCGVSTTNLWEYGKTMDIGAWVSQPSTSPTPPLCWFRVPPSLMVMRLSLHVRRLQADDTALPEVADAIDKAIHNISSLQTAKGDSEKIFDEMFCGADGSDVVDKESYLGNPVDNLGDWTFAGEKASLIEKMTEAIRARFKGIIEHPAVEASSVLQPKNWLPCDLHDEGANEQEHAKLKVLASAFEHLSGMKEFNLDSVAGEWRRLKHVVLRMQCWTKLNFAEFWCYFLSIKGHVEGPSSFPNMVKLIRTVLLVVSDTSCAERGFSLMNRIHTAARNRLFSTTLDRLMRINSLGPSVEDFDPTLVL